MSQSDKEMSGKICMVTGATLGLGRVTAEALAAKGATVIVVARNAAKGESTVSKIKAATGNPAVVLMLCDLASQASIRQLAEDYKRQYTQLHVLVNNAGAMNVRRTLTPDGYETTFAVNHLGYFLLTNLLLDVIKASAPSRIVNVSSDAHFSGKINFSDLQGDKRYSAMGAYSQSKLANVMFTIALAKRLQGTGVTVNAVHPGAVATGFGKNNGPLMGLIMRLVGLFELSPEQGAETQIYLATSPEVANVTGKYFEKKKPLRPNLAAEDETAVERLWQMSEQLTGLTQ